MPQRNLKPFGGIFWPQQNGSPNYVVLRPRAGRMETCSSRHGHAPAVPVVAAGVGTPRLAHRRICAAIATQMRPCCCRPRRGAPRRGSTVGQKPVKADKTLGMFRPPESLNSARMGRMAPLMNCSGHEEFIDGVMRSIRVLFNDSGGRNMPRIFGRLHRFLAHCGEEGSWNGIRRTCLRLLHRDS